MTSQRRRAAGTAAAIVLLSGCATSMTGFTAEEGGYAAGDDSVVLLPEIERTEPVELSGTTLQGQLVDITDWRGAPVVLNSWWAGCGPCREEAPALAAVAERTSDDGVRFLDINIRDGAAQGLAFEEQFGIGYPSLEASDGAALLPLRGVLSPTATPTTLVLDAEGRVAGRISGPTDESTLRGLVDQITGT
ncbi:TlpA family protein disulfide reductase [Pseudokineococcus lusitanus]|uniref:TlpA family protein disulfide reductase n=1 Tax=Pseudokineococcus lusitanus TaxID=763993 RepID=UPI0011CE3759|nr:TlpA disulfide reductase family protein [Pseudokineococcus lusitanus]